MGGPMRSSHCSIWMCQNTSVVLPDPVPPLIKNANLASIMRDRSCAAPGVNEPESTQSLKRKASVRGHAQRNAGAW